MKTLDEFITFLKDHEAYDKFMVNLKTRRYNNIKEYYDNRVQMDSVENMVSAFFWHLTPEGGEYWSNLDDLWGKEYQ